MKVGWLVDTPRYIGGAELTQAEFRAAAPSGVEVVDCPPGEVVPGLDRAVVHNCTQFTMGDLDHIRGVPTVRYVHDLWPNGDPDVRDHLLAKAQLVFCSPLHLERFRFPIAKDPLLIPPAVSATRFRPTRQMRRNGSREGTCSMAGWRNPGKGGHLLLEYAAEHGPVDVYGAGEYVPFGVNLNYMGELDPGETPATMWRYERLVFFPSEPEPFCRAVAEAHFAGLKVTTNNLVGARHWLENDQRAIDTAAGDFWEVVLS